MIILVDIQKRDIDGFYYLEGRKWGSNQGSASQVQI